jgi:hypothetical protein
MAQSPNRKKKVSFFIDSEVMEAFEEAASSYVHNKQKGLAVGAALLMFLESDPVVQGQFIERMAVAEIRRGVDQRVGSSGQNGDRGGGSAGPSTQTHHEPNSVHHQEVAPSSRLSEQRFNGNGHHHG